MIKNFAISLMAIFVIGKVAAANDIRSIRSSNVIEANGAISSPAPSSKVERPLHVGSNLVDGTCGSFAADRAQLAFVSSFGRPRLKRSVKVLPPSSDNKSLITDGSYCEIFHTEFANEHLYAALGTPVKFWINKEAMQKASLAEVDRRQRAKESEEAVTRLRLRMLSDPAGVIRDSMDVLRSSGPMYKSLLAKCQDITLYAHKWRHIESGPDEQSLQQTAVNSCLGWAEDACYDHVGSDFSSPECYFLKAK